MKDKKKLIISVVSVLALVVMIISVSYAMFTANLTGTKENKIKTGTISLNCAETNFELTNAKTVTDAQGIANGAAATCTLTSTMSGTMTLGYDFALYAVTPSTAIRTSDVKIRPSKTIDGGSATYLAGSTSTTGVTIASIAGNSGTYDHSITGYKIDSATISGNHSVVYTIPTWLATENTTQTSTNTNGVCSDATYITQATCEAAGEIWGYEQKKAQAGGTFTYKLKIGATQVLA